MATNLTIKRRRNEPADKLVKRFIRKTKKSGIIPVVLEPYLIAVSDTDPIIPFSPPPKIMSKLFSAMILPTVLADFMFSLFLPDLEPPNTHIFFFKITSNKEQT